VFEHQMLFQGFHFLLGLDSVFFTIGGHIMDLLNYSLSILISLGIGLTGFIIAYKIFDWMTPGVHFSDQLKADNKSVAIFLAGLFIGLGLLLGNAIK
jgi:uncharacterized membrane protein YjfL (UPF0719 family)